MNRTDRLMAIILLLRSRKKLTARELAGIFEVSERTIYRDIDALCQAQVPIAAEPGPEGGYSLLGTYSLPPVMFDLDEAVALFLGTSFIAHGQAMPFDEALKTALIKIEDILPDELQESVHLSLQSILFDAGERGGVPLAREVFQRVNEAILERRCIQLTYDSARRGQMTERVVAPYGLIYDHRNGAWYLVGFCYLRGEQRMFHMGRVRGVSLTDRPFEIPGEFKLENLADRGWAASLIGSLAREQPRIRVRVSQRVSERLRRSWFFRYAEREETADGKVIVTYHDHLPSVLQLLRHFGSDCEVLEPSALRDQVVAWARQVLAVYGEEHGTTDRDP